MEPMEIVETLFAHDPAASEQVSRNVVIGNYGVSHVSGIASRFVIAVEYMTSWPVTVTAVEFLCVGLDIWGETLFEVRLLDTHPYSEEGHKLIEKSWAMHVPDRAPAQALGSCVVVPCRMKDDRDHIEVFVLEEGKVQDEVRAAAARYRQLEVLGVEELEGDE